MLRVCQALGCMYQADGRADQPADEDTILRFVESAIRRSQEVEALENYVATIAKAIGVSEDRKAHVVAEDVKMFVQHVERRERERKPAVLVSELENRVVPYLQAACSHRNMMQTEIGLRHLNEYIAEAKKGP